MRGASTAFAYCSCLVLLPFSLTAQELYISTEIGIGLGNALKVDASDTDFPTLCDNHLDPQNLFSPVGITEPDGCSSVASQWTNSFDGSNGLTPGVALGAITGVGARIEGEYSVFRANYDATSFIGGAGTDIQDKLNQEFVRADERIGAVGIDNLFANAYYDFPVAGRLRPYLGGGVGVGFARLDYNGAFARNLNPDAIRTADGATYNGDGDENQDRRALHERIAGTTSTASHTLRDTVLAFQAVGGVDYLLNDSTSIGIKGRWVKYGSFSGGSRWDQVRSHSPDNGPGTQTVTYSIATDDLSVTGVTLVLKYRF